MLGCPKLTSTFSQGKGNSIQTPEVFAHKDYFYIYDKIRKSIIKNKIKIPAGVKWLFKPHTKSPGNVTTVTSIEIILTVIFKHVQHKGFV